MFLDNASIAAKGKKALVITGSNNVVITEAKERAQEMIMNGANATKEGISDGQDFTLGIRQPCADSTASKCGNGIMETISMNQDAVEGEAESEITDGKERTATSRDSYQSASTYNSSKVTLRPYLKYQLSTRSLFHHQKLEEVVENDGLASEDRKALLRAHETQLARTFSKLSIRNRPSRESVRTAVTIQTIESAGNPSSKKGKGKGKRLQKRDRQSPSLKKNSSHSTETPTPEIKKTNIVANDIPEPPHQLSQNPRKSGTNFGLDQIAVTPPRRLELPVYTGNHALAPARQIGPAQMFGAASGPRINVHNHFYQGQVDIHYPSNQIPSFNGPVANAPTIIPGPGNGIVLNQHLHNFYGPTYVHYYQNNFIPPNAGYINPNSMDSSLILKARFVRGLTTAVDMAFDLLEDVFHR